MLLISEEDLHRIQQRAELYRKRYLSFDEWSKGYGVIQHSDETQVRVFDLCQQLVCTSHFSSIDEALVLFKAADQLTSAAMWLVVHMTYAKRVDLSGGELSENDFKVNPQGHTGGSLNMVPAYVGYMVANTLAGKTRSWLMGQGHCVAAIDSVNVLLGNLLPEQASRYGFSEKGLSQLVEDFYSYAINDDGLAGVPVGSHVNPHTAGGLIEGGYLGFAELQYVHMPLPGEHLVAFLSDGAFEEQRGSDWVSRWWRAEDCGLVTPVMIANGRRIEQRSTMYQQGGLEWFYNHLELNGFHPIAIDGRDPAAFIWSIFESELRLQACSSEIRDHNMCYPVKIPYVIAEAPKGYGFYGAGTNAAHGTPLPANPRTDRNSKEIFNEYAGKLHVDVEAIKLAVAVINSHAKDKRSFEKDNPLAWRNVKLNVTPELPRTLISEQLSPMEAIDDQFVKITKANPELRVRVGNPDELRSNKMNNTLDALKHRVIKPEDKVAESIHGAVITALNEESVICAALGNKGGLNIAVSYESFAPKMLGALRQEIIFSRHQKVLGRAPKWLSVPVIATSHLWENGKNEQSHQDPSFGEILLNEMNDISRVLYPADALSAAACLNACYQTQGQIWAMTVPKQPVPSYFSLQQAKELIEFGAAHVSGENNSAVQLVAIGAYQLTVCIEVMKRLNEIDIATQVTYLLEPGRFRIPRDKYEEEYITEKSAVERLFPSNKKLRIFVCHMHPEIVMGICRPLDLGAQRSMSFGYINRGGTLDTAGLLQANKCDTDSIYNAILNNIDP